MNHLLKSMLNSVHNSMIFKRRVRVLSNSILDQMPPETRTVLDLGCGDGTLANRLMNARSELTIEGVDVFERPNATIPVKIYDGNNLPYDDNAFDVVVIVDVLHHAENPDVVLAEALRVSKHRVILKDHLNESKLDQWTLLLMDWVGNRGHDVTLKYNYLSSNEWHKLFDQLQSKATQWTTEIGLYRWPLSMAFGRGLHVITSIEPTELS